MHIYIPLGAKYPYDIARTFGQLIAQRVHNNIPEFTSIIRQPKNRQKKVYLDYLQNRHGQTIVAPYSVRPLPGATVSMPLVWDDVNDSLDPKAFTIRTAVGRMELLASDPIATVLDIKPEHVVVRIRSDGLLLHRSSGDLAYALVDYELLERLSPPKSQSQLHKTNQTCVL